MVDLPKSFIQAFQRPELYPHPAPSVEHIQTHISHVFLAGDWAYKLKKPLNLGFLDFSTLEARIHYCREELQLNRRLAPRVYDSVWALVKDPAPGGGLALAPLDRARPGAVVEPCLKMVRMDGRFMMDRLLKEGKVSLEQVRALARLLAGFYAQARRGPGVEFFGRLEQVRINVEENFRQTQGHQGLTVAPARWRAVRDYSLGFMKDNPGLFARRVAGGHIVDGHGDLHSGNINLPKRGGPIIFDCIEFNQRFRFQDVACDLGFLAMDLDHHGRGELSRELVEGYRGLSGDQGLDQVLDFYKCYRAVVRAKIHGMTAGQERGQPGYLLDLDRARDYFRLAAAYAQNQPPFFMVCMMGLMGTGKSYLAKKLAGITGWERLSSDDLRKERAGMRAGQEALDDWGQGLYSPERTRQNYQALMDQARWRLAMGASVIVDASFIDDAWRGRFLEMAGALGAAALFVEVWADEKVVRRRLASRRAKGGAASDGRLELVERQAAAWQDSRWLQKEHGLRMDGGAPQEEKLAALSARLKELGYEG